MEHAADFGGCHHLTLVNRRLEASDMLHRHAVRFARLQVFVESGEDLIVEDLDNDETEVEITYLTQS